MALGKVRRVRNGQHGEDGVPRTGHGAQTARSLVHFAIGKDTMPGELIGRLGF